MIRSGLRAACVALLILSTPAASQRSSRRVYRAEDIAAAGWHRLGDIVVALPPGSVASIDGFNHQLTSSNVPFADRRRATSPAWSVRLDGQAIPVVVHGIWILDALPVAMTQIDSVVITNGPRIVDGRAVFLGIIDLYTRRPAKNLSAVADYQHGDESGDPGPYRYTTRANPNVEKLGPFASGAVAFGRPRWSLDGAARYSSLNITDQNIVTRFPTSFGQLQSDVNASGGSGVLTTALAGASQHTMGGRGRFTGLLWVPSLGREESARVIATHAGSAGSASFERFKLRYGLTGTALDVAELKSPLPFSIGHTRTMLDGFAAVRMGTLPVLVGAGVASWGSERAGATETRQTERLWLEYEARGASAAVTAEHRLHGTNISASGMYDRRLSPSHVIALSASFLQTMSDANDAWIDHMGMPAGPDRVLTMSDLRAEVTADQMQRIVPTAYVRLWQTQRDAGKDARALAGGFQVVTQAAQRLAASVRGEANFMERAANLNEKSTPAAFLEASLSTTTSGKFLLAAAARYSTKTTWYAGSVDEEEDVPSIRRVDLSVNKPFWHNRVRAQLVIRNLLDTDERYHPSGAQWNLRTHLAVTVALPPYHSATVEPDR